MSFTACTLQLIDNYVNNELYLGMESTFRNTTIKNCIWHNTYDENCSKDVSMILYADNKRDVVSTFVLAIVILLYRRLVECKTSDKTVTIFCSKKPTY